MFSEREGPIAKQLVKCVVVADGPGPSEKVVQITTEEGGNEEVVLDASLVSGSRLEVGVVGIDRAKDRALVELPRESASGRWRLWIPKAELVPAQSQQGHRRMQ